MKSDSQPGQPISPVVPTGAKRSGGIPSLHQIIRHEIEAHGPMTFARFMELALYHPEHGYYASGRARIGRKGDFFTNVSVGPVFGKLLAAQFAEVWEKLGRPPGFTIVEQGAHDGQFAADVLSALRGHDLFDALSYIIVEPFPVWRQLQKETLRESTVIPSEAEGSRDAILKTAPRDPSTSLGMTDSFKRDKVSWVESIDQLEPFTGIHFSNELFDSLPVHLIAGEGGEWKELFVTFAGTGFRFEKGAIANDSRRDVLLHVPNSSPREKSGTCRSTSLREVNLAAVKLMREIATKLSPGVILTIDYGFTREEYDSPERSAGTLQVRARHRKLSSPFEQIGSADISAHVEWTSLIQAAESAGAKLIGLTDQHRFLTGILAELLAEPEFTAADKRALLTLLHPEMLGRSFQVLALGKNFASAPSGFRLGRDLS
jgi:SAM-dependent MidA family methyltransferase